MLVIEIERGILALSIVRLIASGVSHDHTWNDFFSVPA
jgi:hypothetical protein